MNGWIRLSSKLKQSQAWHDPWHLILWIALVLRGWHYLTRMGFSGSMIKTSGSSFFTLIGTIAAGHQTEHYLVTLIQNNAKNDSRITSKAEHHSAALSIYNYRRYPSFNKPGGAALDEKRGTGGALTERAPENLNTKTGTNNNLKNLKNERILKREREESGATKISGKQAGRRVMSACQQLQKSSVRKIICANRSDSQNPCSIFELRGSRRPGLE